MRFQITDQEKNDKRFATFIAAYFLFQSLNLFVKIGMGGFAAWNLVSRGVLGVLLFIVLIPLAVEHGAILLIAEVVCALPFAFSYFFGFTGDDFFSIVFNSLVVFLPLGLSAYYISNLDVLFRKLYVVAWPGQILVAYTMINMTRMIGEDYSMSCGYAMLLWFLILMDHFFTYHKWYDLVGAIFNIALILFSGSRGPIVCIGVYVILKTLFSNQLSKGKRLIVVVLLFAGIVGFYIYYQAIALKLYSYAQSAGFNGRSLRLLINNNITSDSGRSTLVTYYLSKLQERPVLGYGLAGGWISSGSYPHNIIVEFLYSFGYPIGVLITCIWVVTIVRGTMDRKANRQRLSHIFIAESVMFFMSNSFLLSPVFFLCLAVCARGGYDRRITEAK